MIVVDSSVLIAVLKEEDGFHSYLEVLGRAAEVVISAATLLEARLVVHNLKGTVGQGDLDELLANYAVAVVAFDNQQSRLAFEAFQRFGKGVHPRAKLNFGDCISYALAKSLNAPLLFKGDDFPHTDIVAAV